MATGDEGEDTDSAATVDAKPARAPREAPRASTTETVVERPSRKSTTAPKQEAPAADVTPSVTPSSGGDGPTLATPAEAMRVEEIRRMRQFMVLGWLTSIAAIGVVPLVDAPYWMDIAFVASLIEGMALSMFFYRRFGNPANYSGRRMVTFGLFVAVNTHIVIGYFGVFSAGPMICVLGIHFIARGEDEYAMRTLFLVCLACYAAVAAVVIAGIIPDPGVFASEEPLTRGTLVAGAVFVLGIYVLAYYTGRIMRRASLSSITGLQQQTRLAAQRKALLDELRADLERALKVGGPGRYTGQVFGGYKLSDTIGRGAMGEVYDARHETSGEVAAVKLLRRELLLDPTHVARFARELGASRTIESRHVVRVLAVAAEDEQVPYLAMERLHGQTLAEVLRRDGRLTPGEATVLCRHAGAGIDAAAAAGIVHRDLKPQNLFRVEDSDGVHWKILDFGVASLADHGGTLTGGGLIGTPSYMAPEQASGGKVDPRADVFSLAAVIYRCLTGRVPFAAPDTPAVLYAVVHRMPARPVEVGVLPDLERWVALALAKDPSERIGTGAELADSLEAALAGNLDGKLRKRADAAIRRHGWDA